LSKSVGYYLEIIEASLLYIQAKTFADNHRWVFHFSEFNASDFLAKKSEKSGLDMDENKQRIGFFSYEANIIIDQL